MTLSVNPASVGEADGATAVVVTAALDGGARGSATAVTVAVGAGTDSATEGTDYATVPDFTVTIGAGVDERDGDIHLDADAGHVLERGRREDHGGRDGDGADGDGGRR